MVEMFEQPIKMMEKTTALWQDMLANSPWMGQSHVPVTDMWKPWLAGLKSANELSLNAWKILIEQGEDIFFRSLKESRLYSQAVEENLRENWERVKKAQKSQSEAVEELLSKMEGILCSKEESA